MLLFKSIVEILVDGFYGVIDNIKFDFLNFVDYCYSDKKY